MKNDYVLNVEKTKAEIAKLLAFKRAQREKEVDALCALLRVTPLEKIAEMARAAENPKTRRFFIQAVYERDPERGERLAKELL